MLRPGVLSGRSVALAGAGSVIASRLEAVGARVTPLEELAGDRAVDTLVADCRPLFAEHGGGYPGLRAGLDGAWAATRTIAAAQWIDRAATGQVVLVGPAPGAGRHAGALRAALENLVRTLGTEWARHQVTTVALLPGDRTAPTTLADLCAWLASPAGAYLTGTALMLDLTSSVET